LHFERKNVKETWQCIRKTGEVLHKEAAQSLYSHIIPFCFCVRQDEHAGRDVKKEGEKFEYRILIENLQTKGIFGNPRRRCECTLNINLRGIAFGHSCK
jgi:hypothetical protein